ncbi:MAG: NUDIX hydrolase [Aquisalimonadaceae bacterium]
MTWKPHVTVAAIIENAGRFLLVEEMAGGKLVLNNPAGHLEPGESLVQAVIRETREETAWRFQPTAIVGIYRWHFAQRNATYLRVCYCGTVRDHDPEQALDDGIQRTLWLSREELDRTARRLRSPLVLKGIDDFLADTRYPLDVIQDILG